MIYLKAKTRFNMNKTFRNQNYCKGERPITVKVGDVFISFHFTNEGDREFYDIPVNEWVSDKTNRQDRDDNWHNHMMEKVWFSQSMKEKVS